MGLAATSPSDLRDCRQLFFLQLVQNEFLQKSVEINLEQTQVTPGSDRRTIMVAQICLAEIVFGGDDKTSLVQHVQPCVRIFRGNPQGTIGEWLRASVKLLQVDRNRLGCGMKKSPQFRFDVKFPFRTHFALGGWRGRAKQTLLSTFHSLRIRTLGNLS